MRKSQALQSTLALAIIFFLFLLSQGYKAEPVGQVSLPAIVTVRHVHDGDTLSINSSKGVEKIRLYGIDSPELGQKFGREARDQVKDLTRGKSFRIERINVDKYKRAVVRLYEANDDQRELNSLLVELGLAHWYRFYAPHRHDLKNLEIQAQKKRIGLWKFKQVQEPWEYRSNKLEKKRMRP